MTREIYLATGLYDNKVLTLFDNENLQIKLVGKTYPNITYCLKAKMGDILVERKFVDNLVEIKRNELSFGKLKGKIFAMANENIIKEYALEDLILQELNGKIAVIPQVVELSKQVEIFASENEKMKKEINELRKLCNNTKELVIKLNEIKGKVA